MADAHKNFATSTVATAPSPATSGTSLVVASGEGTRFPATPFNAVIAPATADATPANAEVVRVTNISTDTFTITRAQESSSARTVVVGDRIYAGPTAKSLTDIEAVHVSTDTIWDTKGDLAVATGADAAAKLAVGASITDRLIADSSTSTGLKWVPHIIRRSSDSAAVNSGNTGTTLTNDDTLLWAVAANEVWFMEAFLLLSSANATMDSKFGFSVPTGTTMFWGGVGTAGSGVPGYGVPAAATSVSAMNGAGGSQLAASAAGGNIFGVGLAGTVVVSSTAGNVNLQWAQNTADAGNLVMKVNSILRVTRLA